MSSSSHLPLTSTLIIVAALAGGGIATSALVTLPATVNAASDADATPVYTDFSTFKPIAGPITVVTPGAMPTAPPEKSAPMAMIIFIIIRPENGCSTYRLRKPISQT